MFSFIKTPLVFASVVLAALPAFTSASRQACTVSLKFPSLGQDAVVNGWMQYQMYYDPRACEGTTMQLRLTSPSTATPIPCALTSRSESATAAGSIFRPDATNMVDLFCAVEKQDMFPGEEYTLLINVDGQKSTKKFTTPSDSEFDVQKEKYGVPPPKMFCGATESLCPTSRSRRKGTYAWTCLPADLLTSCGGCPNIMAGDEADSYSGEDCTEIPSVGDVSCSAKKCVVKSCDAGHELINNRCIPSTTVANAFKYVSNGKLVKQTGNRVVAIAGRLHAKKF